MSISPHAKKEPEVKTLLAEGYGSKKISQLTGVPQTSVRRMISRFKREATEDYIEDEPVIQGKAPKIYGPQGRFEIDVEETLSGCVVTGAVTNLQDIWEATGMSPDDWLVPYYKPNFWTGGLGKGRVVQHTQAKATMEPRPPMDPQKQKRELLEEVALKSKARKYKPKKVTNGMMAEFAIYDLHIGKFADPDETGEAYDLEIADNLLRSTVKKALDRLYPYRNQIEKFLFPIGNDWGHVDNLTHGTTKNMHALDTVAHLMKIVRKHKELLIWTIETLTEIAPIELVTVPGNHDHVQTLYMAEIIDAWFRNDERVTVDLSLFPRKYRRWNNVLLGYAHGQREKRNDLPLLMVREAEHLLSGATWREFRVGHKHFRKEDEHVGFRVKQMSSLSAQDRWHAEEGYRPIRSAEMIVWDAVDGEFACFNFPVTDNAKGTMS